MIVSVRAHVPRRPHAFALLVKCLHKSRPSAIGNNLHLSLYAHEEYAQREEHFAKPVTKARRKNQKTHMERDV